MCRPTCLAPPTPLCRHLKTYVPSPTEELPPTVFIKPVPAVQGSAKNTVMSTQQIYHVWRLLLVHHCCQSSLASCNSSASTSNKMAQQGLLLLDLLGCHVQMEAACRMRLLCHTRYPAAHVLLDTACTYDRLLSCSFGSPCRCILCSKQLVLVAGSKPAWCARGCASYHILWPYTTVRYA